MGVLKMGGLATFLPALRGGFGPESGLASLVGEKDRTTVRSSTKPLAKHCYSQRSDRAFVLLTRHASPVLSQSKAQLSTAARSAND